MEKFEININFLIDLYLRTQRHILHVPDNNQKPY